MAFGRNCEIVNRNVKFAGSRLPVEFNRYVCRIIAGRRVFGCINRE